MTGYSQSFRRIVVRAASLVLAPSARWLSDARYPANLSAFIWLKLCANGRPIKNPSASRPKGLYIWCPGEDLNLHGVAPTGT